EGRGAWQIWSDNREANLLDGGAHFYDSYETKDGRYVSIAPIEPQFYALLLEKTGLKDDPAFAAPQMLKDAWPALKQKLSALVKTKTREEWSALLEGTDACFAPVLSMAEAPDHPHNAAREAFTEVAGLIQPNAAPKFSRTPGAVQGPAAQPGAQTAEILADWKISPR